MNSATDVRALTAGVRATMTARRRTALDASFAPGLGMLGTSLRHHGEELLASDGIPFLHPWANRLEGLPPGHPLLAYEEHGLPIHGVPPTRVAWRARTPLAAELDWSGPALEEVFPYPHRVRVEARVGGDALSIRTTLTPVGDVAVPLAFGFHPYFRLPRVPRGDWRVALPARRHLLLDERLLPTGDCEQLPAEQAPLGDRAYDDLFEVGDEPAVFELAGGGRRITVRFDAGFPYAQVFAPPGADLICFEPMTAPVNALHTGRRLRRVEPGESFIAQWSVEVRNTAARARTRRA